MAYLQASGAISMSDINGVFGWGNDLNSYRGRTWYTAAGGSGTFSSGTISMSDFYGKGPTSAAFSFTISTNQQQADLRTLAVNAGWNQSSAVTATIASGVYIWSDSLSTAALTITGSFPNGVTLVNNGYIMGRGGNGGGWSTTNTAGVNPSNGSSAISLGVSCTIQNNSYIGGGGGGGGQVFYGAGGGGAGGGIGGTSSTDGITGGGAGGGVGGSGSTGNYGTAIGAGGGGGGRIMPGTTTASPTATAQATAGYGGNTGVGGSGSVTATGNTTAVTTHGYGGQAGGAGGAFSGTPYYADNDAGGGGGGWGSSGGTANRWTGTTGFSGTQAGGAGGYCVALNGNSVTWSATGTRYGAIA